MNYSQVKKLDEDTQRNLQEGSGPVDECLCSLLAPPDEPKGLRGSIKRAIASIGGRRPAPGGAGGARGVAAKAGGMVVSGGQNSLVIPLTFDKGGKGIFTTKEEVKRASSCGKCGCDSEKFFLKHSYANIRITSPDVSSICPCKNSACMPGTEKLNNNISVTVEHMAVSDQVTDDHGTNTYETEDQTSIEETKPIMDRTSAKELVEHVWKDWKTRNDGWSGNVEEEVLEDTKTVDSRPKESYKDLENSDNSELTEEHEKYVFRKPTSEV